MTEQKPHSFSCSDDPYCARVSKASPSISCSAEREFFVNSYVVE